MLQEHVVATKRRVVQTNRVAGTYLLSLYQGSSERLTSSDKIRCKRASKDFENLNIFRFLSNGYSLDLETWSRRSKFIHVANTGV